jgi:hypothetical protein
MEYSYSAPSTSPQSGGIEGERFVISVRPSSDVQASLPPGSRDSYDLYAYPWDNVDFTLSRISSQLGIDRPDPLVLVDRGPDGQFWVLPEDQLMEQAVNQTGTTTFIVDFL